MKTHFLFFFSLLEFFTAYLVNLPMLLFRSPSLFSVPQTLLDLHTVTLSMGLGITSVRLDASLLIATNIRLYCVLSRSMNLLIINQLDRFTAVLNLLLLSSFSNFLLFVIFIFLVPVTFFHGPGQAL